jgi:hypothetical protein
VKGQRGTGWRDGCPTEAERSDGSAICLFGELATNAFMLLARSIFQKPSNKISP